GSADVAVVDLRLRRMGNRAVVRVAEVDGAGVAVADRPGVAGVAMRVVTDARVVAQVVVRALRAIGQRRVRDAGHRVAGVDGAVVVVVDLGGSGVTQVAGVDSSRTPAAAPAGGWENLTPLQAAVP